MAKTKISKLAKDLNVALNTVIDFLHTKNVDLGDITPNTRVEDNIADMLFDAFDKDRKVRQRVEAEAAERAQVRAAANPKPEPKPAAPEMAKTPSDNGQKYKVLGKVELDSKGNVIKPAAPKAEVKPEVKPEPKPEVKAEVKAEPKPAAPKPEVKAEAKPEHKAENKAETKPAAPKAEPEKKPKAEAKPEHKPEPKAEPKPAVKPEVKAEAPKAPEKPAEPEFIATETPKGPTLNIVGKIDLSAINQNTRPKKRGRHDRGGQGGAAGQGGEKKKRQRIGGGRVDIEKTGAQVARDGAGNGRSGKGGRDGQGGRDRSGKGKRNQPVVPQEVSE